MCLSKWHITDAHAKKWRVWCRCGGREITSVTLGTSPKPVGAWCPARRSGFLRHTARSAEGCCRQALTRFAAPRCAGPDRRARHQALLLPGPSVRGRLQASVSGRWRGARAAESARLEIVCGETHRGFKSHPLRQVRAGQRWFGGPPSGASGSRRTGLTAKLTGWGAAGQHGNPGAA